MGRTFLIVLLAAWLPVAGSAEPDKAFFPPPCDVLVDGGFEFGRPSPTWIEDSDGLNVLTQSSTFARTGEWLAVFGGQLFSPLTQSLEQSVSIPAGRAVLSYYLRIPEASTEEADFLRVKVDDQVLAQYTVADATDFTQYRRVSHDISLFADENIHAIRLEGFVSGSPITSFRVEDVSINICAVDHNLFLYSIHWLSDNHSPQDLIDYVESPEGP